MMEEDEREEKSSGIYSFDIWEADEKEKELLKKYPH